ncbi:YcxB family protein [Microbulbifer thermotolerans]|uniref:YcxB family protein n=1 Tax=Microbulbifer thermotolerans TaxID=252514 RepID=UPI00224AA356|nr:YcxB family protein [Microbulbifer thermotolerans]MCX2781518.1 YcxB family protein [Microbulbifer thermotolerans]MCX2842303.1 YcxB family protein [Microbulbifer thermotolerans]
MIIETKLEEKDWKIFSHYIRAKALEDAKSWVDSPLFNVFIWLMIAVVILGVTRPEMGLHWQSAVFTAVVCAILFFSIYSKEVKFLKNLLPTADNSIYERRLIEVSESGIRSKNSKHDVFLSWDNFTSIEYERGLIMFFINQANAIVIPAAQVPAPTELVEKVRAFVKM